MGKDLLAGMVLPKKNTGIDLLAGKTLPQKQTSFTTSTSTPLQKPSMPLRLAVGVVTSYGNIAKGLGQAITSPLKTAAGITATGIGAIQSAAGHTLGLPDERKTFDEAKKAMITEHYGSWDKFKNFVIDEPVQAALDVATVLSGAGKALQITGKLASLPKIAKAGEIASAISESRPLRYANPITPIQSVLSKPLRSIAPYSKDVAPDILALKQKYGLDLPASAISKNPEVADIEGVITRGRYSERILSKYENAQRKMTDVLNDTINKTGQSKDLSIAGQTLTDGLGKYDEAFTTAKNQAYLDATLPKLGSQPVALYMPKTLETLDNLIENEKLIMAGTNKVTTAYRKYNDLRKALTINQGKDMRLINAREVQAKLKDWNQGSINNEFKAFGKQGEARKIGATMSEEFDSALETQRPDIYTKLQDANKFYKEGRQILESRWAKNIQTLSKQGNYSKIIPAIFNENTTIEDLRKISSVFDDTTKKQIQSSFLGEVMKDAINTDGYFKPNSLSKIIDNYGEDKLGLILTPEQLQATKDISLLSKALGKVPKPLNGAQTAFIGNGINKFFNVFATPIKSLSLMLSQNTAQRFYSSPLGQKILTTGIQPAGKVGEIINAPGIGYSATQLQRLHQK